MPDTEDETPERFSLMCDDAPHDVVLTAPRTEPPGRRPDSTPPDSPEPLAQQGPGDPAALHDPQGGTARSHRVGRHSTPQGGSTSGDTETLKPPPIRNGATDAEL